MSSPPQNQSGYPPPNWRVGRQRMLVGFLRAGLVVVAGTATAALVLPGSSGHRAAMVMVSLLVAIPGLRVAWLALRWARLGDRRFATLAGALVGVLALASVLAR